MSVTWKKSPWGYAAVAPNGVRWSVRRAPSFRLVSGKMTKMFWVYRDGSRYTSTGKFDNCVNFLTLGSAKAYAAHRMIEENR